MTAEDTGHDALARSKAEAEGLAIYTSTYSCRRGHPPERYIRNGRCVECTLERERKRGDRQDLAERRKRRPAKWTEERAVCAEAMTNGNVTYQSTKPCPQGHLGKRYTKGGRCVECARNSSIAASKRLTEERRARPERQEIERQRSMGVKRCKRCEVEKPWSEFQKSKIDLFKVRGYCKSCDPVLQKEYLDRRRADGSYEDIRRSRRRYYYENREKCVERSMAWSKANPEKHRQNMRATEHRRRAALMGSASHFTTADIRRIFKEQKGKCAYHRHCGVSFKRLKDTHIDHIVALSKGGHNGSSNIQLTCRSCNLRKNAKPPEDWAAEIGLLL